jgi:membrane protein
MTYGRRAWTRFRADRPFVTAAPVSCIARSAGCCSRIVEGTIRPYVLELLAGNEALRQVFEKMLEFVGQTGVASLGFLGLLLVLYAATRLLRNIEAALNELWGAKSARNPLQQLRDYVAIIVVTPLCLMAAAALTTVGQAFELLRAAGETLGVSGLLEGFISLLGPLTVLFLGLLFLYMVLPTTSVRIRSAAMFRGWSCSWVRRSPRFTSATATWRSARGSRQRTRRSKRSSASLPCFR